MFTNGQHRCHHRITALHHGIGNKYPQHSAQELAPRFAHIEQIARYNEEAGHMKRVDHLLGIRIAVADENQVKGNHQHNQHTLHEVYFGHSAGLFRRLHHHRFI